MKRLLIAISSVLFSINALSGTDDYDLFNTRQMEDKEILNILEQCEGASDDFIKSDGRMPSDMAAFCGSISSEVRRRFFNDDFVKFLEWRKSGKPTIK